MNIFMMMQAAGDAVAEGAELAEGEEKVTIDLIELVMQGGWIMIPLFLLSFVAIYIFIERYLAIKRASREDKSFMNRIKDYIHEGKIDSALALCEANDNPVSRMIAKGITRIGRPLNDVNTAIENVGNMEVSRMEKGLPVLATVAGGAPMIGFTGTVIGMIKSFWEMSNAGSNIEVDMLAGGIYTALVTTVTGLIVGIIAYFAYNWLVARVENVIFKMESRTMEFMDLLNEPVR
ncbi:MotA/TolQ/ExbB proton channel family protein [Marinilabilia sp.]|uniref:MotA/TolQ/ExbB proton channel family protein n=1 Tax=Marinilabilia sp. TaxID=2021252 RepID=UPI0025BC0A59|nr:MotA/TolQ/ExbB proton channel family protein [Marinilabilia sp.]